jgi:hypothetical protein
MVDHVSRGMRNKLIGPWTHVVAAIPKLSASADIQPSDLNAVLRISEVQQDPEAVTFDLETVVVKVPETRKASRELFVGVRGRFAFHRAEFTENDRFVTNSFATEVGYFVRDAKSLVHAFGIHYDFSLGELAHPAFHAQLRSFADFAPSVQSLYRFEATLVDEMKKILRNVRVPTAQMDVFSVFLQVCADHLLHSKSTSEERAAFDTLLERAGFCVGAAWRIDRLMSAEAGHCYRSRHWYPLGV